MKIDVPGVGATRPSKLLGIGRNYAAHAAEMQAPKPERPVVFLKPASALIGNGGIVRLPRNGGEVHHEVELVAVIGRRGHQIDAGEAAGYVAGYALGLDMTARSMQAEAKAAGLPWSIAKGFDTFAPLGEITPAHVVGDPQTLTLCLDVGGEIRQAGRTAEMLFPVAELVAFCSTIFTLEVGDLIYTGTPAGVAAVGAGDILEARCDRALSPLRVTVAHAE